MLGQNLHFFKKLNLAGIEKKVINACPLAGHWAVTFSQIRSKATLNLSSTVPVNMVSLICVEIADALPKVAATGK